MDSAKMNPADTVDAKAPNSRRTMMFYSPDLDFCVSMRLLFQDRFNVVTVSDPDLVMVAVRDYRPYLMIVDSAPTKTMVHRFEVIKQEFPQIRIMTFYAPHLHSDRISRSSFRCVDAAFSKPIDLAEVTKSMNEMLAESG